jgi:hypothetical protein
MKTLLFIANHPWSPVRRSWNALQAKLPRRDRRVTNCATLQLRSNDAALQQATELCEAGQATAPPPDAQVTAEPATPPTYWMVKYWAMETLQYCRTAMTMLVVCTVPVFLLFDEADPVSLVLNTISVMFILEVRPSRTLLTHNSRARLAL